MHFYLYINNQKKATDINSKLPRIQLFEGKRIFFLFLKMFSTAFYEATSLIMSMVKTSKLKSVEITSFGKGTNRFFLKNE